MATKTVTHTSATQIGQFYYCPISYYFSYVKGIKPENNSNIYMAHGTAIHAALAFNYKQKITSRKDLPAREIYGYFKDEFTKEIQKGNLYSSYDIINTQTFCMLTETVISDYMEKVAPKIMPLEVEFKVEVQLKNYPIKPLVIIDLITEDGMIIDHKTIGKSSISKWSQKNVDNNMQLTLYAAVYRKLFNKAEKGVAIHLIPRSLDFGFKEIRSNRTQESIHQILSIASSIEKIVELGVFMPNLENCGTCPFSSVCPKVPIMV